MSPSSPFFKGFGIDVQKCISINWTNTSPSKNDKNTLKQKLKKQSLKKATSSIRRLFASLNIYYNNNVNTHRVLWEYLQKQNDFVSLIFVINCNISFQQTCKSFKTLSKKELWQILVVRTSTIHTSFILF